MKKLTPFYSHLSSILFLVIIVLAGCGKKTGGTLDEILETDINVQVNPYKRVPLGGLLTFRTGEPCKVEIKVDGASPIAKKFSAFNTRHSISVLGLYADTVNRVTIKLTTEDEVIYTGNVEMNTAPLPDVFPTVEVSKIDRSKMEPGMHLVEMLIANNGKFLNYTIMFDDNGDIRWFMDMSEVGQIAYAGLRLTNGNWTYLSWIDLWELDELGKQVKKEQLWDYAGTHQIIELDNDNILIGGSRADASVIRGDKGSVVTRNDHVVKWDRKANKGVKSWDMAEVVDIQRSVYPEDYSLDFDADWFHINGIALSPKDNSILVSGRNQGVVKVDQENNLKWILAPHTGWGRAGRDSEGLDTKDYLLTALDSNGAPLPKAVQLGTQGRSDFEWPTGQHATQTLSNGNLLMFDNGLARNLDAAPSYSRAVEYKIDEENKTIQQVWSYGKSYGMNMYSPITSDVDVLPQTGNRLITAGNVRAGQKRPHSKMVEITYPENEEVFEAKLFFKDAKGNGQRSWAQFDLVFRGERYSLYKD